MCHTSDDTISTYMFHRSLLPICLEYWDPHSRQQRGSNSHTLDQYSNIFTHLPLRTPNTYEHSKCYFYLIKRKCYTPYLSKWKGEQKYMPLDIILSSLLPLENVTLLFNLYITEN